MAKQTWRHERPHQQSDIVRVIDVRTVAHWETDEEYVIVEDAHYRGTLARAGEEGIDVLIAAWLDSHYGPRPHPYYRLDGTISRCEWTRDAVPPAACG